MTVTSLLFRAARTSATVHAATTGHLTRRAKNIAVGRVLAKAGFWKGLWR